MHPKLVLIIKKMVIDCFISSASSSPSLLGILTLKRDSEKILYIMTIACEKNI